MRIKTKADRRERIKLRQRKRIMGTKERPRLSVFRSESHIYAQVIDDLSGQTLVSASSVEPTLKSSLAKDVRGGNLKGADAIGKVIAERSIEKGIKQVVFDIPNGIEIAIDKQTHVTVTGVDRQQVGQVAANMRRLRKPDPYKQKGVRYTGEVLKKKAGKTGAK